MHNYIFLFNQPCSNNLLSTYWSRAWPAVMWLSCILAVTLSGTIKDESQYWKASPPSPPKKPTEYIPLSFASLRVSITFLEFPEVVIANNTSPLTERAENTLLKTSSGA